jgi:hypothetical protein
LTKARTSQDWEHQQTATRSAWQQKASGIVDAVFLINLVIEKHFLKRNEKPMGVS